MTPDSELVALSNWAFTRVDEILVLYSSGSHPPPHADFETWLQRLTQPDYNKLIIYSEGGSPSPTQRSRVTSYLKSSGRVVHVALMTDSVIARGILTAIEWVVNSGTMRSFPLTELDAAAAWMKIEHIRPRVDAAVEKLRAALPVRPRVAG